MGKTRCITIFYVFSLTIACVGWGQAATNAKATLRNHSSTTSKLRAPRRCPSEMSVIPTQDGGFCIDRYEASLVEVLSNRHTKPHSPFQMINGKRVKAVSKKGVFPQAHISQIEAKVACEEAGKRLCTVEEWELVCRGKNPTKYPYGDEEVPGRCNDNGKNGSRAHPMYTLYGNKEFMFASSTDMNNPRLNQLPGTLARTGSKAKCRNSYGVYDMVGNLHEWTADPKGRFNGGYYMDTHRNGDGCEYKTTAHNTAYRDYSTGFRCCK